MFRLGRTAFATTRIIIAKNTTLSIACQSLLVRRYVTAQNISNLHLSEHKVDNASLPTLNALRTDNKGMKVLVTGEDSSVVASQVAELQGISKIHLDREHEIAKSDNPNNDNVINNTSSYKDQVNPEEVKADNGDKIQVEHKKQSLENPNDSEVQTDINIFNMFFQKNSEIEIPLDQQLVKSSLEAQSEINSEGTETVNVQAPEQPSQLSLSSEPSPPALQPSLPSLPSLQSSTPATHKSFSIPLNDLLDSNTLMKFIEKILSAENREEKKRICLENSNCMTILKKIYGPKKFHVTSNAVEKFMNECSSDFFLKQNKKFQDVKNYPNVLSLLEALSEEELSGHKRYFAIGRFIHTYCKDQESKNLMFNILDKNLKIGLNNKIFDKIFPGEKFIGFQVALSHTGNISDLEKLFQNQERWYASQKMDGVRCIIKISPNAESIVFYSRNGRIFHSLKKVEKKIKKLYEKNINTFSSDIWSNGIVLDGEICVMKEQNDGSLKENFTESIQIKKSDGSQLNKPRFFLFDCLTMKEFEDKKGDRCFSERYKFMRELFKSFTCRNIILIDQNEIKSEETLKAFIDKGFKEKWEGIILRKDTGYEGKRSNSFLKFKTYQDIELIVKDVKFDKMMISINNKMEEKEVLSKIIVDYQGNDVGVGSGFTNEQRIKYKENPDLIKGKEVTIKYFEESTSKNKTGKSLRFPTFKAVWEEGKRNI